MNIKLSYVEKFNLKTQKRNEALEKKDRDLKKKISKNGSELLKKHNYYIFISIFLILYVTINTYVYLDGLNNNVKDDYHQFLEQVYNGGLIISVILGILYAYAFLSYMFYPVMYNNKKEEVSDPIIINFIYFLILSVEFYLKRTDDLIFYTVMIALLPLVSFLYLKCNNIKLYVESYNSIILKTLFFSIFAFFIINSQYVMFSFQLINNDFKNNIQYTINNVTEEKKEEILAKLVKNINDKNISNKQLSIYTKDNETHILIKEKP